MIGSGGFSCVYLASVLPEPKSYAVKCLDKKMWHSDSHRLLMAASDLAMEAKLLSRLNHENIIQLHGMSRELPTQSFNDQRDFFLVLDLLDETLHERTTPAMESRRTQEAVESLGIDSSWDCSRHGVSPRE